MNITQKTKESFYQCKICIGPAIHSNYGVISCPSCKMFFKRNVEMGQGKLQCDFDGQCQINTNNRHMCSSCRLDKCFASGMRTELIRGSRFRKNSKRQKKNMTTKSTDILIKRHKEDQSHLLPTLNLLQADQSTLTIDQSNLFSNLMLCYDEQSGFSLAERFIFQQNILPLKFRFKCRSVNEFLSSLFGKAQLLFEKNSDFRSLYSHDRSILLHRQMKYIIIITSSFITQQSHLFHYPAFNKSIETLGGMITAANKMFCFDIPFLKLSLAIISFSSFDYTIYENVPTENLRDMKRILQIQDMYIELAWRYLVYVHDDKQAIICFSNLVRCILNVISNVILMQDKKTLIDMMNFVIEQTEHSFTVNSE